MKITFKLLSYIFVFVLGFLLGCKSCNKPCVTTTIEQKDTTIIIQTIETRGIETPKLANTKKDKTFPFEVKEKPVVAENASTNYDSLLSEYNALKKAFDDTWTLFDTQKNYVDTFRFKHGVVGFKGSVFQNNLFNLQATLDSVQQLQITEYKTIPPKNKLFFTMSSQFVNYQPMQLGAGFTLVTKKDRFFGVKGFMNTAGQVGVQGEIGFKIKVK